MTLPRRTFLKQSSLAASTFAFSGQLFKSVCPSPGLTDQSLIGIQMGPHSLLDEGKETVLDFLSEETEINALMLYSHIYYGSGRKPLRVMAHDHGVSPRDKTKRNLRMSWVRHRPQFFEGTSVRHQQVDSSMEYHQHDIFHEIRKPASDREMKVYVRMLEAGASRSGMISNYDTVLVEDVYGNIGSGPCWNHPEYRNWAYSTMEDIFDQHELDGLRYGAERTGPLSQEL